MKITKKQLKQLILLEIKKLEQKAKSKMKLKFSTDDIIIILKDISRNPEIHKVETKNGKQIVTATVDGHKMQYWDSGNEQGIFSKSIKTGKSGLAMDIKDANYFLNNRK